MMSRFLMFLFNKTANTGRQLVAFRLRFKCSADYNNTFCVGQPKVEKNLSSIFIYPKKNPTTVLKMPSANVLRFAKLTEFASSPVRGSEFAAGCDLKSAYDYTVPARDKLVVLTDIQVELPTGCYGRVAPRSGLAAKHFIDVGAGVIDEDYRGNVGVVLFNHGPEPFEVKRGDRIAQLICEQIVYPQLEEVPKLGDTVRGAGGFGSTGTQ